MEIEQSFHVPFAPADVWRCFHDTEGIVACLPGAAVTAPPQDGQLKLSMTVKLGPIVAAFAGDGELRLDDVSRSGGVTGAGSDRKSGSRVKGEAAFSLHDVGAAAPSTRVDVKVNFSISGTLAQFSREGIVRDLAERMTAAFSANLKTKLEAESLLAPAPVASVADVPPVAEAAAPRHVETPPLPAKSMTPPAAPLDLGALFWPMLLARLKRLFGQGKKTP